MSKSILENIHETVSDLHNADIIKLKTMNKFDALCLPPVRNLNGHDIKRIREKEGVSQPVFAAFLNTSKSTVSKWERNEKKPFGMPLKLLNIVESQGLIALVC
jgi:putative transcriptional regulator